MIGRVALVVGLLAPVVAGCSDDVGGPARVAEGPTPTTAAEGWVATDDDDALFTVDCPFSHRAPDDPIVHPGAPGTSHSHEFFGSTATDAGSTGPSLRGTATTCEDPDDTAAYWVPTLFVDGVAIAPTLARAYYRAVRGADVRTVVAPPLGLAMISGAGGHADGGGHHDGDEPSAAVGWGCGLRPRHLRAEPPADCTDRSPLTLQLRFPDCWDGERLDSEDHQAHVADSTDGACPPTHPVLMSQLQVSVVWPVAGAAAGRVTLSSGPAREAHGDFLNGWDPAALEDHVDLCIRSRSNCTIG